jgi:hypothetical protein
MLAVGGDLRKSKATFGNKGRTFNRANFQGDCERFTFSMG